MARMNLKSLSEMGGLERQSSENLILVCSR